jgi:hypothetical protein
MGSNTTPSTSIGFTFMPFQAGCLAGDNEDIRCPLIFLGPGRIREHRGESGFVTNHSYPPDGLISMPLIGDIQAAGLTADTLAPRLADRLNQYFATPPSVSVSVKAINSYSVYVLGEVAKPGKYQLKAYITVLQPSHGRRF